MKKEQLIELIQIELGESGRFGDRTIALKLDMAFADAMFNIFSRNIDEYGYYRKYYKDVEIQTRTSDGTRYIELPEKTMQVPGPEKGIVITKKKGRHDEIEFAAIKDGQNAANRSMEVGNVDNVIGFIVNKNIVEFDQNIDPDIETVNVGQVIPPSAYEDDEDIALPSGVAQTIVMATVGLLKEANPYKKVDNENPNTV